MNISRDRFKVLDATQVINILKSRTNELMSVIQQGYFTHKEKQNMYLTGIFFVRVIHRALCCTMHFLALNLGICLPMKFVQR